MHQKLLRCTQKSQHRRNDSRIINECFLSLVAKKEFREKIPAMCYGEFYVNGNIRL